MNDGVNTPEQAARSLGVVRLVSFAASAGLAVVVLIALAALRYAPLRPEPDVSRVVLSEIARPPEPEAPPPPLAPPPREPDAAQPLHAPTPAPEAPAIIEPVVITDPVWVERPRNPERFYPREAFMQEIAGEVVLDCDVGLNGRLDCAIVSEKPQGRGFGDAALRIAGAHIMRPPTRNGAPAPARYRMTIPFSPGG
jgi:TonB family protein